jgi:methionine sulfoxide reductase heme-binding subunit
MIAAVEKLSWYMSRSSGLVAWVLATAAVVWGLTLSSRIVKRRGVPAWLLGLHRYLGTLTLVFTAIHVAAIGADNWVHFGWADTFVPFASSWRPWAVAWGIVAFWLLIAVEVSSWLMRRLPRRVWHTVHLASLLLFASATVHLFTAGADAGTTLVQFGVVSGVTLVVALITVRLANRPSATAAAERPQRLPVQSSA